jgi:tetratricopeptide (TPR) repeat protein
VWNGQTRSDIERIYQEAQELDVVGKRAEAEIKLRQALEGFENLLTPAHDDTNTVAYHLADFYARSKRMLYSDLVLNRVIQLSMDHWGIEHSNTRAHLVRIADLFQGWSRTQDAISLLAQAANMHQENLRPTMTGSGKTCSSQAHLLLPHDESIDSSDHLSQHFDANVPRTLGDHPIQAEHSLTISEANSAGADAIDDSEASILQLINQCEKYPGRLSIQILKARRALLELYQNSNNEVKLAVALVDAETSFWSILQSDVNISVPLIRAAIEVIAIQVRYKRLEAADNMFYKVQGDVVDTFGVHDDITISILISIGIIYQEHDRWADARRRFEQALSASMVANGLVGQLTQNLENALEKGCYTTQFSKPGESTSAFNKRGPRCIGHEFGCCDTRSLLNALFSQNKPA